MTNPQREERQSMQMLVSLLILSGAIAFLAILALAACIIQRLT